MKPIARLQKTIKKSWSFKNGNFIFLLFVLKAFSFDIWYWHRQCWSYYSTRLQHTYTLYHTTLHTQHTQHIHTPHTHTHTAHITHTSHTHTHTTHTHHTHTLHTHTRHTHYTPIHTYIRNTRNLLLK